MSREYSRFEIPLGLKEPGLLSTTTPVSTGKFVVALREKHAAVAEHQMHGSYSKHDVQSSRASHRNACTKMEPLAPSPAAASPKGLVKCTSSPAVRMTRSAAALLPRRAAASSSPSPAPLLPASLFDSRQP